jgi:hypothetical protein
MNVADVMAESDIGTVRMPVQHALEHASPLVAPWLVGKPTRTATYPA